MQHTNIMTLQYWWCIKGFFFHSKQNYVNVKARSKLKSEIPLFFIYLIRFLSELLGAFGKVCIALAIAVLSQYSGILFVAYDFNYVVLKAVEEAIYTPLCSCNYVIVYISEYICTSSRQEFIDRKP